MKNIIFIYLLTMADGSQVQMPFVGGLLHNHKNETHLIESIQIIDAYEEEFDEEEFLRLFGDIESEQQLFPVLTHGMLSQQEVVTQEMVDYFQAMSQEEWQEYLKYKGLYGEEDETEANR